MKKSIKTILSEQIRRIRQIMSINEDYDTADDFRSQLTDEEKRDTVEYVGRSITWYGTPERSAIIPVDLVDGMFGNIYYPEKIEELRRMVEDSEENFEFLTSYCHPAVVTISDIMEEQTSVYNGRFEVEYDGQTRPSSIGDDDLDRYLGSEGNLDDIVGEIGINGDFKSFLMSRHFDLACGRITETQLQSEFDIILQNNREDEEEMREGFRVFLEYENNIKTAIANEDGDLGDMRFQLRDGHHRFMVAKAVGESYILCDIDSDFDIAEVKKYVHVI